MAEAKRRYQRFNVSHCETLSAEVIQGSKVKPVSLVSIGQGGCSFFSPKNTTDDLDTPWIPPEKISLQIRLEPLPEPIHVEGHIIYLSPHNLGNQALYHYGVQFIESSSLQIKPLIEAIEQLAKNTDSILI